MGKAAIILAVLILAAVSQGTAAAPVRADADAVDITSNIRYILKADDGPSRVSWDVTIVNNDPSTSRGGDGGVVHFYEGFSFPVLADARNLTASSGGTPLTLSTTPIPGTPVQEAAVKLSGPLYYGDKYSLSLAYEIADTRKPSLLVMPAYAFVPIIALGDTATVSVALPPGQPWANELVPAECTQDQSTFNCSGSDGIYVAALAEISRPDLTATTTVDIPLRGKQVTLSIKYFQGEDAFAQHMKDLATNALPVLEDLHGVPYFGPQDVRIEERGRVITLGYEGLATCSDTSCSIAISPVADDHTALHEMAHLWSKLYSKRWLAEGFAEFMSNEAAARLPQGLVVGSPVERPQASVDLQLDNWGDVKPSIGVNDPEAEVENAGYYRSQRFMELLQATVGLDVIKKANGAIATAGGSADSRNFMDALEEAGGGNHDDLFVEWVFPTSVGPSLVERRQARDRFYRLSARAAENGLSDTVPQKIHSDILQWKFQDAFARLDDAEAGLDSYAALKGDLTRLEADARSAGLTIGASLEDAIKAWQFDKADGLVKEATAAVLTYQDGKTKIAESRSLWQRFGLIGSDPDATLRDAAAAFNAGDYEKAGRLATDAIDEVDGATGQAERRILIVTGGAAAFALLILLLVWYGNVRDRRMGRAG